MNELSRTIRVMTKKGILPRYPSELVGCSIAEGGDQCSACGRDKPDHTYTLTDKRQFSFHRECERMWRDAQMKPPA
jgi:hypothetical protein